MSFENELRDLFDDADTSLALDDGSLASVKKRAQQRTTRARLGAGMAALALVVAGGAIFTTLDNQATEEIETIDDTEETGDVVIDGDDPSTLSVGRVTEADLTYRGAFLVPSVEWSGNDDDPARFGFGGNVTAFNPYGDPNNEDDFAGSMFMTGFVRNPHVAEISIPTPEPHDGSTTGLPVAEFLQPFAEITGGRAETLIGSEDVGGLGEYRIGGLEVVDGPGGRRLHWTAWQWFDVSDHDNPGHGHSSLDLSNPDPEGPWYLGDLEGYTTAGYVFSVPQDVADDSLGGRELIAGFHEKEPDASSMSQGSPFVAFSPPDTAAAEARIADPLELANYRFPDEQVDGFSETGRMPGAAWVSTTDGRSAVVTVGNENQLETGDCTSEEQPPLDFYGPKLTFYDTSDLAAVAAGSGAAHEVAPYLDWDPSEHLIPTCGVQITSISVDAEAGLVYIVQILADTSRDEFDFLPVIHVFDVG